MGFKNPLSLARSGFAKSFAHYYPQSLFAATQSSSASQTHPFSSLGHGLFNGKASSAHQHGYLNNASADSAGSGAGAGAGQKSDLAAYYAHWAKQSLNKQDWHQYQFQKRIACGSAATEPATETAAAAAAVAEEAISEQAVSEEAASEQAVSEEAASELSESLPAQVERAASPALSDVTVTQASVSNSVSSERPSSTETSLTEATSQTLTESYTNQLTFLAESQRYDEIPAVFQSMLRQGVKPSASAYNALLMAAIHLPRPQHQIVPKALEIYSDMLLRRVEADTVTYAVLIELLSTRAASVQEMQSVAATRRRRYSASGRYLLPSDATDAAILEEDDSLAVAVKLFDTAVVENKDQMFTTETYRNLIAACAQAGRIEDVARIYAIMEAAKVQPSGAIFAPMIQAYARTGNLKAAVECYDEYKTLAIANDAGMNSMVRKDEDVYAAVISAYLSNGRTEGGLRFFGRIQDTLQESVAIQAVKQAVYLQALYPHWLADNQHQQALSHCLEHLAGKARTDALTLVVVDAADKNLLDLAVAAFGKMKDLEYDVPVEAMSATVALALRSNEGALAGAVFKQMMSSKQPADLVDSATMLGLTCSSSVAALQDVRQAFENVRTSNKTTPDQLERLEEAVEVICASFATDPSVDINAAVEVLRLMLDNGALISSVAESILANIGPQQVSSLALESVLLLTRIEAALVERFPDPDAAHIARFQHLVELASSRQGLLDDSLLQLVNRALTKLGRPLVSTAAPVVAADFDPYAASTDFKGSTLIAESLDRQHLYEAMGRLRNIRRAGRHPRVVTYSKLVAAAAKEGNLSLAEDLMAMARQDVPLVAGSAAVRNGWIGLLDSMIAACLNAGDRQRAERYHDELLRMGAAPSANTFGLYITTLKESTKTFDEATEAVKIFHRAKTEQVEPSSFLYNALIGKLGKARRIDDCLYYFTEMRNLGIRATSVTYGTIVNALCRVSDAKFAEELFDEMESQPNYKPRPAPYNSLMQFFLTTKRDRSKVLEYYERMLANGIRPTQHTFKLLIDAHATLEPVDMPAAESLLQKMGQPDAVHYASLIHAKGCVLHDSRAAVATFEQALQRVPHEACLYQALFESLVANHNVASTEPYLQKMHEQQIKMTPYIANSLIHGWSVAGDIQKAKSIYTQLGKHAREPSTYDAMTRAWLNAGERGQAMRIVNEVLSRGYPQAVVSKITDLVSSASP